MSLIIKYTQAQYKAKITELEGYESELESHLEKLKDLRSQMFNFWEDQNAQEVGNVLNLEIRSVERMMAQTKDSLRFYRSSVDKLSGADVSAASMIKDALGLLSGL